MTIRNFHAPDYRFLSLSYGCGIEYDGYIYTNAEAAYQAQKDLSQRERFLMMGAAEAKFTGRTVNLRPDWNEVKLDIMEDIQRAKFQIPTLRSRLVGTCDAEIEPYAGPNDLFWTKDPDTGEGENNLGKILMKHREEARTKGEISMTTPKTRKPTSYKIVLKMESSANTQNKNGAYIAKLILGEHEKEFLGSGNDTTYNRMGLEGIIEALEALNDKAKGATVEIHSSCNYIHDTVTMGTLASYMKNNWITDSGVEAKNRDLWEKLLDVKREKGIKVKFSLDGDKAMKARVREMVRNNPVIAEI